MMERLKIMIADEEVLYRNIIARAVDDTDLGDAERTVPNDSLVLEWLEQQNFDLILMDSHIAAVGQYGILTDIKRKYPHSEIIIMSKDDPASIANTLEALKYGAIDFIVKPKNPESPNDCSRLRNQLRVLFAQIIVQKYSAVRDKVDEGMDYDNVGGAPLPKTQNARAHWEEADIILIASSTGGPTALETVFSQIPDNFEKPVLVVQHMPAEFTKVFAQTLDKKCRISVSEGKDGEPVKEGHVIIAPGGKHMKVKSEGGNLGTITLEKTPPVNGVRPSADVLFASVAQAYEGKSVLAIILTGMGNDGLAGVTELKKRCNCYCITQSEQSCIVYGMPRRVFEAGLSDEATDLNDIAGRMCQMAAMRRGLAKWITV